MAQLDILVKATDKASKTMAKVGKSTAKAGEMAGKHWKGATLALGGAAAGIEALARGTAEQEKAIARLSAQTGLSSKEMRDFTNSLSNVTFPLEDVTGLLELAHKQGIRGTEALAEYANFWDTVGDATGLASTELAKATGALKAVGIDATNTTDAMAAFGFITENTSIDVKDFLGFIEKGAFDLKAMGLSIDQTAGLLGLMESELGLVGKAAKAEFAAAAATADGELGKLLETLGLTEEQLGEYTAKVQESSGVIQRNADIHADSFTPLQKFQHQIKELTNSYGGVIKTAAEFAPLLMAAGPAMKVASLGIKAITIANASSAISFAALGTAARVAWLAVTGPIGLIVLAIAGVVTAGVLLVKNWDKIKAGAISAFGGVQTFVRGVVDKIVGYFQKIPDRLVALAKTVAKVITFPYRMAFEGFRTVANLVIDALNSIPDFSVPSWVPGIGGQNFGIPDIPKIPQLPSFAGGGTVPGMIGQPVLAVVHGGEQIRTPGGSFGSSGGRPVLEVHFHFGNFVGTPADLKREMLGALVELEQTGSIARITA